MWVMRGFHQVGDETERVSPGRWVTRGFNHVSDERVSP